jgi:dCMP deaminase
MMAIAFAIAERSTCLRRKVGAVATDQHGRILAVAHNGSPKDYPHCIDTPCAGAMAPSGTGLDICEAVHAEMNLLSFCPDNMRIDTIYVTTSPCIICIKSIANTSCRRIVFAELYPHDSVAAFWQKIPGRSWEYRPDINSAYADPSRRPSAD